MEIKKLLENYSIIGIVSNYKSLFALEGRVSDLKVKNISKALKIVGLNDDYLNKELKSLSISELWKIDLLTKLDKDIIIIGNLYNSLIYKDREYIKKLLNKLAYNYNKKIVIIDNNVNSFFEMVKKILVIRNKRIVFETCNVFDKELYKYVNMPKIIEFINYVESKGMKLDKNTDIYELIKDIYRRISV